MDKNQIVWVEVPLEEFKKENHPKGMKHCVIVGGRKIMPIYYDNGKFEDGKFGEKMEKIITHVLISKPLKDLIKEMGMVALTEQEVAKIMYEWAWQRDMGGENTLNGHDFLKNKLLNE